MQMDSTAQAASIALNKKVEKLSQENAERTIYRVHSELSSVNEKAYEPKVIAIGPYHRDKPGLKMMEDHKLRNLQSLIKLGRCNVEACAAAVGKLESEARKCYADQLSISRLSSSEFVEMLVLDGCFIVELVRKFEDEFSSEEGGSIFLMDWMIGSLQRDLMLFENQIPFFVLSELFELVNDPDKESSLVHLLFSFFSSLYPGEKPMIQEPKVDPNNQIKHLLDFIHRCWLPPQKSRDNQDATRVDPNNQHLLDCWLPPQKSRDNQENWLELVNINATRLREANVQFKKKEAATATPFDIEANVNKAATATPFDIEANVNEAATATLFDIEFKDGVLLMPPLPIEDDTECLLRNLVVYEQYFKQTPDDFVTDYIVFLDCLINSPKDVELLSRNEILQNFLGDDEVVAKIVNRLGDSVTCSRNGLYAGIAKDLNDHCQIPWNRWMAKLRRNYLNSPWAIISIIGAIVLLLLTITQTVFSILQ